MAGKRRRKSCRGQLEDDLLKNQRCSGLHEQRRLQALNYSPQQNAANREACRRLQAEGFGSDEVYLTWLYAQK